MANAEEPVRAAAVDEVRVPLRNVALYCLSILSVATAVIHFAVSGAHFQEYSLFGVFMLVVAWLQLLWAIMAITRPAPWVLWSGAILNVAVICVYIVTRTAGDIVGPTPSPVEPFGFGDGLCTVLEAVVAAGCGWLLVSRLNHGIRRQGVALASAGTGAVTAALLSIALVAGGPDMVMSMTASAAPASHLRMQMAGGPAAGIRLATASPAGDITMPDPNMQMAGGMKMASSAPCTAIPTKAQRQAAVRLVDGSWQAARKYQSLAVARAAGYRPITPAGAPVVHYLSRSAYLATVLGGPVLRLSEPQSLVYANTPNGAVLVAAMYITTRRGATPQPGGCLTQWHVHTNLCTQRGLSIVAETTAAHPSCPAGSVNRVTPPMMHVWFVPIPGGPTAIDASDGLIVRAAEQVTGPRNNTA
jgi:hypothetical protein